MTNTSIKEKILKLEEWAKINKVDSEKISKVFNMLKLGPRADRSENDPVQFPKFYIEDNNATAWHDASKYKFNQILIDNFEIIKKEALDIFEKNLLNIHPDNEGLADNGTWKTFFFYQNGKKLSQNHEKCPNTSAILASIPGTDIAGRSYFSIMTPGIHIKPHCGPHNFKLRTHLGIDAPVEAVIRVADKTLPWITGGCITFDDSFEHEVWNKSERARIVLIVDVWNPSLTSEEIAALEFIMPEFYNRSEDINAI